MDNRKDELIKRGKEDRVIGLEGRKEEERKVRKRRGRLGRNYKPNQTITH